MDNGNQPATKQDLRDLEKRLEERFATRDDLQRFATKEDLWDLGNRLEERFATREDLVALKDQLVEAFHDAETRLLGGFYGFLDGAQKRFTDLDRTDTSVRERLDGVEKRLTELERRVNFPDFNPPPSSS
jgi:hypothetical protein